MLHSALVCVLDLYSHLFSFTHHRFTDWISSGPRQCVGKAVTLLEMRFVTAILLKKFHISFSEGYNPDEFWENLKDQVTMQAGDLFCTFKLRI
jgi:cytochrome P450